MKIRISIDDLRKGKYCPTNNGDLTDLSSQELSEDQTRAIVQFLYEIMIRSEAV